MGIVDCLGESKLCHETLGLTRNTKGELRYFRSGHKNCEGGVQYLGQHIVDLSVHMCVCVFVCVCVCVCVLYIYIYIYIYNIYIYIYIYYMYVCMYVRVAS